MGASAAEFWRAHRTIEWPISRAAAKQSLRPRPPWRGSFRAVACFWRGSLRYMRLHDDTRSGIADQLDALNEPTGNGPADFLTPGFPRHRNAPE